MQFVKFRSLHNNYGLSDTESDDKVIENNFKLKIFCEQLEPEQINIQTMTSQRSTTTNQNQD